LIIEDSHIKHLLPKDKDKYPEKAFDFSNLLCSCQKNLEKGEPLHCGNSKNNDVIPISPLDKDCEKYFKYTFDGHIKPVDETAKTTIKFLFESYLN